MNIADTQRINFEILSAVLDIAEKHGIELWVLGGTEIGAVREKDFIPWDDDVDLQMRFRDYPRLKEALIRELPTYMHVTEPYDMEPYFYDFTVRISDTRYLLREETEEEKALQNLKNHPSAEIFLLTQAPDSKLLQRILYYRSLMLYGQAMGHRYQEYNQKTLIQRIGLGILAFFGKKKTVKEIYERYLKVTSSWENRKTGTVALVNEVLTALTVTARDISWKTCFLPADWFSGSAAGRIRGRDVPVPAGFHEQLTMMYGDYMTPTKHPEGYIVHLDQQEMKEVRDLWEESQQH